MHLLRATNAGDLICQQCHVQWYVDNANAQLTHPIVADYATIATANPTKFRAAVTNIGSGDVRLVNGGVSCTSCHTTHFSDSDSTTVDAKGVALNQGDGNILRSDGPERTNADPLLQAQLRSNLCQACHTYLVHGNAADGGPQIGCLDCHGGHSYNGGVPNVFVLSALTSTPQPRNANAVGTSTFPAYTGPYAASTNEVWSNKAIGIGGYCEECHGDVQSAPITGKSTGHSVGNLNGCTTCHMHGGSGWTHSWQPDVSAATCGDCHGFPPKLNVRGDRNTGGTDSGFAYDKDAQGIGNPWDYQVDSGYFKNEAQSAHNTHAGGSATNPTLYFVGSAGTDNCNVCHGDNAGFDSRHQDIGRATSFRDVPFFGVATDGGALTPAYLGAAPWTCNNVYCHTNGGPKNNAGVKSYQTHVTPAWDQANGGGLNAILGSGTRCQFCHGNTGATMTTKANSAVHNKHLTKYGDAGCNICHVSTATSNTALAAGATRGNIGGKHVNAIVEVGFDTAYDLDPTATTTLLTVGGTPYTAANGTCAVYCHSDGKGALATTTDWQVTASGACNTCHLTTTLTSGSHTRHVSDTTGPQLSCDKCHGTNAALGTHTGHIDGTMTVTASVCTNCHAIDGGETVAVWGNPATMDCKTCHTGATTTPAGLMSTAAAKSLPNFLSTGHGKPTGTYAVTGKNAANKACLNCHATSSPNHFDNIAGNDTVLPGGYACTNCHNGTLATAVKTHDNTDPTYTNQKRADFSLQCVGCHDPHGSSNIAMVAPTKSGYNGTVVISAFTSTNSFDELDSGAGANNDDICATCHTTTLHNNRAVTSTHREGESCLSCHGHNGTLGGFMPTGGNACNDCHGNPPATGAHAKHASVTINDQTEDRTDCDKCHTGASTYTYNVGGNHQNSAVDLAAGIAGGTTGCTSACHASTAVDGFWTDATGLNCDSCHYYAASPTSAGNTAAGTKALSALSHNKHFDKNKACSACHTVDNGGAAMVGPLTHISDTTGANEGIKFTNMGQSLQDEAAVVRASMTYDDNLNTCSGGIALGCHATGTPDWDIAIPATGCTQCHTDTTTTTVNPASGLHGITPSVSGKIHDATINASGCAACHTTLAVQATHADGTLQGGNAQKTQMGLPAWYTQTADNTGTCATTACHLTVSDPWAHVWTNTASYYTNATTACGGCHGLWANWATGVTNHRTGSEAETVHGTGATYKCRDCHGLESVSGYPFTFGSNDWKTVEAGTTLHGDGQIQVNTAGTTGYTRGVTYGGCTGCHTATDGAAAGQHAFTKTTWTLATITSDAISTSCSSCHGGATVGVSKSNYWPDGANTLGDNATADNSGEHAVHVAKLALKVYGETATGAADNDILRDATTLNPGLTSDAKQKELCSYCHTTPGADGDHGVTYPADVNTMYTLWSKTLDNGALTPATGSCATVDCHNNTTTAAGYYWYAAGTSACAMCHTSGAADTTHTSHLAGTYGRTIACTDCHGAGTTSTTSPTAGHINGTFAVAGSVTFTYSGFTYPGVKGTCSTNTCHNDGNGGTPYNSGAGSYTWGTALTNCTACHNNPNATGNGGARHTKHMAAKVTTYVPGGCSECHPAATVATHIDGTKNATGTKQSLYTSGNGTCTNTCHATTVANGVWTDALAPTCTNCHSGTYIGGGANNASSGLHTITPSVSGKIHNETINGSGCAACHTTLAAQTTTHANGTFEGGNAQKTQMGLPVWYTQTADNTGTCATTACHLSVSDPWAHVWTNTASYYTTSPAACGGCHGDYSGWKAGTTHATNPTRGNTQHTGTGTLTYPCKDCHAIGATNAAYSFTFGSNDWKNIEAGTTQHGDGLITMNSASTTWARSGGRSGCSACHEGATGTANAHDFAATSWTSGTLAGDAPTGGACNSCHGYPPVQRLTGAAAAYTYAGLENYPGGGRAHAVVAHLNPTGLDPTDGWTPCAPCHTLADHNTALGVANLLTQRDISGLWGNEATRYPRVNVDATYDKSGTAFYNMNTRNTTTGMGNCSNTSCHFSESPKWDCIPADTTNDPL